MPPCLDYRRYSVQAHSKALLLEFIVDSLGRSGCQVIQTTPAREAPFRITFETPLGERLGIIVYAFFANDKLTKNRPNDEHRFQVKYGSKKAGELHSLWQDPFGLYTTLFVGINPEQGFFVAADPVLHNPTKHFISIEFKQEHVDEILATGWHAWERVKRMGGEPIEVLVGGRPEHFLRYVRLEREALGEDPGHRQLLAERLDHKIDPTQPPALVWAQGRPTDSQLHVLAEEFQLTEHEVLDLISGARRLKMAVRGWVAEEHLHRSLTQVEGVERCERLDGEGGPDLRLWYQGRGPIHVECKNVLRNKTREGLARLDFQRTRASKADPCSRYYSSSDFDVVAACLHSVTERWEFCYAATQRFDAHARCHGKLSHIVRIDERWTPDPAPVLGLVTGL